MTSLGSGNYSWRYWDNSANNIYISNEQSKYGTNSMKFESNTINFITLQSGDLSFIKNNQDWTIDWWEWRDSRYPNQVAHHPGQYGCVFELGYGSEYSYRDKEFLVEFSGDGVTTMVYCTDFTSSIKTGASIDSNITYNTWNHLAVVHSSDGNWYLFKNGILQASIYDTTSLSWVNYINIGTNFTKNALENQLPYNFYGYISMFRISNTVRWTTNFDIDQIQYYE